MSLFSSLSPPEARADEFDGLKYVQSLRQPAPPPTYSNPRVGLSGASGRVVLTADEEIARLKQDIEDRMRPNTNTGLSNTTTKQIRKLNTTSDTPIELPHLNVSGNSSATNSVLPSPSRDSYGFGSFASLSMPVSRRGTIGGGGGDSSDTQPFDQLLTGWNSGQESGVDTEMENRLDSLLRVRGSITTTDSKLHKSRSGRSSPDAKKTPFNKRATLPIRASVPLSLLAQSTPTSVGAQTTRIPLTKRLMAESRILTESLTSRTFQEEKTARHLKKKQQQPSPPTGSASVQQLLQQSIQNLPPPSTTSASTSSTGLTSDSLGGRFPLPPPVHVPIDTASTLLGFRSPMNRIHARQFDSTTTAGRTLEDELLELEIEKRAKLKERAVKELGLPLSRLNTAGEGRIDEEKNENDGVTRFPPIATAAPKSTTTAVANPLASILPSFQSASGWENSTVQIDLTSHYTMFADKISEYTHRFTQQLQSELNSHRKNSVHQEQAYLNSLKNQVRDLMRFYHQHEGHLYDISRNLREEERQQKLIQLESDELNKQQQLIHEDYRMQHQALVEQLTLLHELNLHGPSHSNPTIQVKKPHEYLHAHSKSGHSHGASINPRTKSISPTPTSTAPSETTITEETTTTTNDGADAPQTNQSDRVQTPSSPSRTSPNSPKPAPTDPRDSLEHIRSLRTQWQELFSSTRHSRDELKMLKSSLIELERSHGMRLEMERMKLDGLEQQLKQMEANHQENLDIRKEEWTKLHLEYTRVNGKNMSLQNEVTSLQEEYDRLSSDEDRLFQEVNHHNQARVEISKANINIYHELEKKYFEQLQQKLAGSQDAHQVLKGCLAEFRNCVVCTACGYLLKSSSLIWETGETQCEKCAFKNLFPQNFQSVVRAMHKQFLSQTNGLFNSEQDGASPKSSNSSSTSNLHATTSASHSASQKALRRRMSSSSVTSESSSALNNTVLSDLSQRLLEQLTVGSDDDEHDRAPGSHSHPVGVAVTERVRRGSFSGFVDAFTQLADAQIQSQQLAQTTNTNAPANSLTQSESSPSLLSATTIPSATSDLFPSDATVPLPKSSTIIAPTVVARTKQLQELSEWNMSSGPHKPNGSIPFTLLWMKNRLVDFWMTRFQGWQQQLDELFLNGSLLDPLIHSFEQKLSVHHQERIQAIRKEEANIQRTQQSNNHHKQVSSTATITANHSTNESQTTLPSATSTE